MISGNAKVGGVVDGNPAFNRLLDDHTERTGAAHPVEAPENPAAKAGLKIDGAAITATAMAKQANR